MSMRKGNAKSKGNVLVKWSPNFAYAIGLIATDGCLYNDKRHIGFTSKDYEMILNYKKCLGIKNKIGRKRNGATREKKYFSVQFGNVFFYDFLISLGIMPKNPRLSVKSWLPKNISLIY